METRLSVILTPIDTKNFLNVCKYYLSPDTMKPEYKRQSANTFKVKLGSFRKMTGYMLFLSFISYTVCPRISDPFYILAYYIKWVTTFWTDGRLD